MSSFYLPSSEQVLTSEELYVNTGFYPTDDPGVLAANGIYTINGTPDPYDAALYTTTATYAIVGNYADQSWVATPLPLSTAQTNAIVEVKGASGTEMAIVLSANSVNNDVMTAVAGQDPLARPASLQTILDEMQVVSDNLGANITAIEAATTVDEINNIVNPPTGVIHIGRTGEDLDPTTYVSFNSVTLTEADTELYIPGTSTVVVYGFYVPGEFDTPPGAFNVGNYVIQIREVATSRVIAEFECPSGYADVAF